MGQCGNSHGVRVRLGLALALLTLASCAQRAEKPVDGVVVLDEEIQLQRGEKRDAAHRELRVDSDSTFVAFVHEEDCDVTLKLEAPGEAAADPRSARVNNSMYGESLELATREFRAGSRLVLQIDSGQDFDTPCHSRLRLLRYDKAMRSDPRVAARLAALSAWASATWADRTTQDTRATGLADMKRALEQLESAQGDRWLAAWARLVRADLAYFPQIDFQQSVHDARQALAAFDELHDARNAARSRYAIASSLIEIAADAKSINPTAKEADHEAAILLGGLATDPALSALQRARAVNFLGVRAFNTDRSREAQRWFGQALDAFRALGDRQGRQMALANLGALAAQDGDFQIATRYFDELVPQLDQVALPTSRVIYLLNAGLADVGAGYVDRAITRLTRALEENRALHEPLQDARVMHALGYAYWVRGDLGQASTLIGKALRLQRTLNDPRVLGYNLRTAGYLARAAGRIDEALQFHQEALSLAVAAHQRLRIMLDLARDYAAIPDYARAIDTCRNALALPVDNPDFYKRFEIQLELGDLLLKRHSDDIAAIAEAESLVRKPLEAAVRRSDINLELAARGLRAKLFAARGKWTGARAEYERAIGQMFRYSTASTNPELQAVAAELALTTVRGYVDLLMRDVAQSPGVLRSANADQLDALRMLEWARAIGFTDARTTTLDPASNARIDALLAQMAGKRVRIAAIQERTPNANPDTEQLELDIAGLRAQIDRIRNSESAASPNTSLLGAPELPVLTPGLTQWSYSFGNEHVYLWVRHGRQVRVAVLGLPRSEIERLVARLAEANKLRSPEASQAALARLSSVLEPAGAAAPDSTGLQIVVDGALAMVPFAAFQESGAVPVSMIGSMFATARAAIPQRRALRFVGVAGGRAGAGSKPSAAFPALGATTREARSIATLFEEPRDDGRVKLLLGAGGSAAALAGMWREGIDVLHVATHGLADLRQPMTSMLTLPALDGSGNPTYLTAGQVQGWRGSAGLVYLSACETAVGTSQSSGGMPGLQRAFLHAGAQGVIATLWQVEDVYASQFAADFYRAYTRGIPAAQALAATQREWSMSKPGISARELGYRRLTAWAHAYFTP